MAECGGTKSDTDPPDGANDVDGSNDVIAGDSVSETNATEPGIHRDQTGRIENIQNIFPPQVAEAVPELERLIEILSLSSIPEGVSPRNVVNIVNEIKVTVADTVEGGFTNISAHLKTKIQAAQKIFVKTVGYEDVCESLDYHGHVLICGSPGSGKTTMSLYIIGEYLQKNYDVVFLEDVSDFRPAKHVSNCVPTLIVFDDIFGYFSLTTKELVYCKRVFNCLKSRFQRLEEKRRKKQDKDNGEDGMGNDGGIPFKVIMNSRTNVLESIGPKLLEYKNSLLRPSTIADLTTLTKLKEAEKEEILGKHLMKAHKTLSNDNIKTIAQLEYSYLGFPHLCELYVDSLCPQEYAVDFFKKPMMYLVNQIAEIFLTDESKDRAGILLLMVLNDGVVNLVSLQSQERRKEDGLERKLAKCEEIVKPLPSPEELYSAARNENRTFLSSEGDVMKFSHPTIHDAVAFVVGDRKPLFVLENCSLQFILERTKVVEGKAGSPPSGGDFNNFMINLTSESTVYLVKRLAKEILGCNFALPLSHHCFAIDSNAQLLFKELSSQDNVETCMHNPDGKYGLGFLFWSSFICPGPLCEISVDYTSFSPHEVMEGCFGCCMSGNADSLRALISYSQSKEEIIRSTLGEILEQRSKTRSFYRSLSSLVSPGKPDVETEKETPRMHGNNSDMLIHIAAANGFSDVVHVLLEHGAEIDARGGNRMTALMHTCYLGHTDLVKMLLTRGADPFALDEEGDNCLHLACRSGSLETVKLLQEKQMDLNARGEHDRTPLMYASYNGHENVVKFLLEKGANAEPDLLLVNNKDNALHLTCINGHTNVAKILLDQGHMNIDMLGQNMRTPLMYACRHGQLETAKELVSRGAKIADVDSFGFTCLHMASTKGHVPTAEWLLSIQAVDSVDCLNAKERTPLMQAFLFGQEDMVQFLLEKQARIDLKDTENACCLNFAAQSGVLSLVDLCLEAGQDINSTTETGKTPAMSTCMTGNIELLQYLVHKGADVTKGSSGGCLHSAAFGGFLEIVKYLISNFQELHINKPGYQERTPLMMACSHDVIDVAMYLVSCGADVGCTDEYHRTCLHVACQRGLTDLVEWLLSLDQFDIDGVDTNGMTPLMFAVKSDNPEVISLLIQKGADMQKENKDGRTYLHSAAWYGKAKSCTKLLDLGMNVDIPDRNNKTPLMSAVSNRDDRSEVIEVLVQGGANIHQRTKNGNTYLHSSHPAQLGILLDLGLDINVRGAYSQTPIMLACRYGNRYLFDALQERGADLHLLNINEASCLHLACMTETIDSYILTELLDAGLNVNATDSHNKTPAMYAISNVNVHTLELLLSRGGNSKTFDQKGSKGTLLHFACGVGNMDTDIPQLLITRGIDVNARDRFYQTPAMCAARKGNRTLVEFLIRSGANLRVVDKRGRTCLSHAEEGDHRELADYLDRMTYRGHRS